MKWDNNILLAIEQGENAVCPCCGSSDTDHGFVLIKARTREGHGSVWCNECKRGVHISRMIVPDKAKLHTAPIGIDYTID